MANCMKNILKVTGLLAGVTLGVWASTKLTADVKVRDIKPYFKKRSPYVFAHRGGMGLRPEHTRLAFDKASEFKVEGFEIDIRLTKDEEIVVFHDAYVDRTSNGSGKVSNLTLDDLRELDFGYHFTDVEGNHPYRGDAKAKIVTLRELLEEYPDKLINIDIKDDPETYAGSLMPSLLFILITELGVMDRVLVTSFYDAQIKQFNLYADNTIALGAGVDQVSKAYFLHKLGFGHMYLADADTFQIPVEYNGIHLDTKKFIEYLTSLNIAVGYWNINKMDKMDELIQKGAHTIVTDYPDISYHLMKERY